MIVSRQNRKIKNIRRLRRCKGDQAILEGPHLVAEALELGLVLGEVLATPDFMEREAGERLAGKLPTSPTLVSPGLFDELCDSDSPRGILALAELPRRGLRSLPELSPAALRVLAEGVQDPGNVGALARTVEAAGGDGLILTSGSAHPNHPRALRASAGSLLRVPTAVETDVADVLAAGAESGLRSIALVAHGGDDLYDTDMRLPVALVIGAEGPGLSREATRLCDQRITIPLLGGVESLNTAVAAAIVMFEIRRRHG